MDYNGRIISEDFAYLCGAVLCGLNVFYSVATSAGHKKFQYRISHIRKNGTYIANVAESLRNVSGYKVRARPWHASTEINGKKYKASGKQVAVRINPSLIDLFAKLRVFKDNSRVLEDALLRSSPGMMKKSLQAYLDVKMRIASASKKSDIDIYLNVRKRHKKIIGNLLGLFDVQYKDGGEIFWIYSKQSVKKIFDIFDTKSNENVRQRLREIRKS